MGGFLTGLAAVVVGGGLAVATTLGVVNTVEDSPSDSGTQVVNYGSR